MAFSVDEILDDLLDNADFEEQASVSRAQKFVTAANRFLLLTPQQQQDQGSSIQMPLDKVENMLRRAQQFIEVKSSTASSNVRFLSAAEGFRR